MLEKVDQALGRMLKRIEKYEDNHYLICITGDHTTPVSK